MQYLVRIIIIFCYVLVVAITIRSLMSWFPVDPNNVLVNIIHAITEPILAPLRRVIPRLEMIDFSPMVATILLLVIIYFLSRI